MTNIEFFKQQAKNLLKDYNTRVFNENEEVYEYSPRFFNDIDDIIFNFEIDEEKPFTLMNAQHVIARLAGFYKWTELIKASEPALELGKLLFINRISTNSLSVSPTIGDLKTDTKGISNVGLSITFNRFIIVWISKLSK